MIYFPAILYPVDDDGLHGCAVPDLLINASGSTAEAALHDAAEIMSELLSDMARDGEPFPEPTQIDVMDLDGGTLVLLPGLASHAA